MFRHNIYLVDILHSAGNTHTLVEITRWSSGRHTYRPSHRSMLRIQRVLNGRETETGYGKYHVRLSYPIGDGYGHLDPQS